MMILGGSVGIRLDPKFCQSFPFSTADVNTGLCLMLNREIRPSLYSVEIRTAQWPQMVNWYRHVLGLKVLVRVVDDATR